MHGSAPLSLAPPSARRPVRRAAPILLLLGAACAGPEAPAGGPEVVRDSVGDTVVVRTVSGSTWGAPARLVAEVSIGELDGPDELLFGDVASLAVAPDGTLYVVDRQVPEVRAFGTDGRYLRTLGRPGEGPGELKRPDGGLAVLSDGRVLVRDPANARIQVFGPDGDALETWPIRGGFNTSRPLFRDRADHVYTQILVDPRAEVRNWVVGLVRIGPDGTPGDTLVPPDDPYEAPALEARREDGDDVSVSRNGVPFSAREVWTLHPDGYFIHGVGTDYRIDLLRPDAPLRIERSWEPVPVQRGERREEELRTVRNMRSLQPDWRWNGPAIPDTKPAFLGLFTGEDGRLWVQVPTPGFRREDPDYDPTEPDAVPDEWREGVAFDVFEVDGTYLGRVEAPEEFRLFPTPVFLSDAVWAVTEDDLGVLRVVRFRLDRTGARRSPGGSP